jgi:hypothetical protein
MIRAAGMILFTALASLPLGGAAPPAPDAPVALAPAERPAPLPPPAPPKPEPPKPPSLDQALRQGVAIVVSKRSQHMYVFKDGAPWGSSPVSTGKRGHPTPSGVFPILQKKVHHRSNLYGGAPMPYMQRLTWGGVALHAGYVPGHPASHGCIRMPTGFAKKLYGLTRFDSTAVLITNRRLASHREAHRLAAGDDGPVLAEPVRLAGGEEEGATAGWAATGSLQTIQLAASSSPEDAAAYWRRLRDRQPRLAQLDQTIVAAVVNGRQVYRLRASAPGAHALCQALTNDGIACLKV